jgi:sialate O-acetylesterase
LKALSLPNTGMATAIDIGVPDNIHPQDKEDVGKRLELAARHVAYHEKLVYSGPIYEAMKVKGGAIHLTFTHDGSGLIIGKAPWVPEGYAPLPDDKLIGFTIAGADKKWVPADAKIVGDTVVVSSPQVVLPAAVRYAWANDAQGNLYNKEGQPASSFRTDDWPDPIAEGTAMAPPAVK